MGSIDAPCKGLQKPLDSGHLGVTSPPGAQKRLGKMSKAKEMKTEEVLRVELEVLRQEHRDLDAAIDALLERTVSDQLTITRLKKQKLQLKDQIVRIEDKLTPDIIA